MTAFYTNVSQHGNYLYVRGFDKDGERVQRKFMYEPYLFVPSNVETGYKNIYGKHVQQKNFSNIWEAKQYIKQHEDWEGFDVYGLNRWPYVYIHDTYNKQEPDGSKVNVVWVDIEVASDDGFPEPEDAEKEVTAITLIRRDLKIVLGCGDFDSTGMENVYYIKCDDERHLLNKFLQAFERLDADVLSGWNSEFFDIPYLINRITKICGDESPKRLSPWGVIKERRIYRPGSDKQSQTYQIFGVACLDYLAVYKKFRLQPRESYKLDHICEVELGEKKIDYSEYGNLHTLYKENYQKFIEYNIRDVDLLVDLDKKLGYMDQIFAIAYDAKVNYNDTLASVLIWDVIIHNYLMDQNVVIPTDPPTADGDRRIVGGYVKDPIVGIHDWVMSFDLNSLYPHLIMQYNISPDTVLPKISDLIDITSQSSVDALLTEDMNLDELKQFNVTMTPNGKIYRKDIRGFLPALMQKMYDDRVLYKEKMLECKQQYQENPTRQLEIDISRYHNLQHAKKIQLNSAYGALANKYFRWFDNDNAEAITMAGQLSIRWIEKKLNTWLNSILKTKGRDYVIAIDTDSVYVSFDKMIELIDPKDPVDFLDKVAKQQVEPFIDSSYQELAEYTNAYAQKMFMKRENIADKAIWTAKKRYIMHVWDSEGVRYKEPELKMMGIEAIRSSTPAVCRDYIKQTLNLIMTTNEVDVQKYIADIRQEFRTLSFEQVAFPRSCNFVKWEKNSQGKPYPSTYADDKIIYKKATPIQVKGALIYNWYLDKYNLTKKYEQIKSGEKIKFCYLSKPNPFHDTVISSPDILPKEFNLSNYLDYEKQFEKGYLDPIEIILHAIGWKSEKVATLEDFFV
jgi:DNA polymerase elongation subunit (family B)